MSTELKTPVIESMVVTGTKATVVLVDDIHDEGTVEYRLDGGEVIAAGSDCEFTIDPFDTTHTLIEVRVVTSTEQGAWSNVYSIPLKTTKVKFHLVSPSGEPATNSTVHIIVPGPGFQKNVSGVVMPRTIKTKTDSSGKGTAYLYPMSQQPYRLKAFDWETNVKIEYDFFVPDIDSPIELQDIVLDSAPTSANYDTEAIATIIGYKQETQDARDTTLVYRDETFTARDEAEAAQSSAEDAEAAAKFLFDRFGDGYLGAFAADPTTDNLGNPLEAGDLYYNTTYAVLKYYSGDAWAAPDQISTTAAAEAEASAEAALISENNAATSEANAANSETAAGVSETNASASETAAQSWEDKAFQWAEETENIEVKPGAYSSKHYATKSASSASAASVSEAAAATSETNAAASETAAASSAQTATDKAEELESVATDMYAYNDYVKSIYTEIDQNFIVSEGMTQEYVITEISDYTRSISLNYLYLVIEEGSGFDVDFRLEEDVTLEVQYEYINIDGSHKETVPVYIDVTNPLKLVVTNKSTSSITFTGKLVFMVV